MKITAAMAVLAFVAVQAAAVPEAAPSGIHARDAEPKRLRNFINFCGVPGQACGRRRDAEPEAAAEADPKKARRLRNFINFCGVPGQACGKARDAPETEVGNEVGYCSSPGEPCAMVKRSANAIAEALAEAEPKGKRLRNFINFCGVPGQACGKARDLIDTVVDHSNNVYGAIYEREAEAEAAASPEAEPKKGKRLRNFINFCGVPGQACGRRRDAEAIADANEKIKRDADAEADPKKRGKRLRNFINFCGVPGQACGKTRNAEAMAEAINKADPNIFKSTCFAEGGDCDTLLKIQKAFHKAKQTNADEKHIKKPQQKLAHCGGKNECTILTHAHQYAKQHGPRSADEAEEKCNGPEGLCTLARRDLEGIEKTIDEAVAAMAADHGLDEDSE